MVPYREWEDLEEREQEQVRMILLSLKEFSYGVDRLDEVAQVARPGSAMVRFYMNSLYQYASNYFLGGGAHKLANVVRSLGLSDLLAPIEGILRMPLDGTTFGEIIRMFRDKILTHQSFTFEPYESRVLPRFDMNDPLKGKRFNDLVHDLFVEIQKLYAGLASRFPRATGLSHDR